MHPDLCSWPAISLWLCKLDCDSSAIAKSYSVSPPSHYKLTGLQFQRTSQSGIFCPWAFSGPLEGSLSVTKRKWNIRICLWHKWLYELATNILYLYSLPFLAMVGNGQASPWNRSDRLTFVCNQCFVLDAASCAAGITQTVQKTVWELCLNVIMPWCWLSSTPSTLLVTSYVLIHCTALPVTCHINWLPEAFGWRVSATSTVAHYLAVAGVWHDIQRSRRLENCSANWPKQVSLPTLKKRMCDCKLLFS